MTSSPCQSQTRTILSSPNPLLTHSQISLRGASFEAPATSNPHAFNSLQDMLFMPITWTAFVQAQVITPPAPSAITESLLLMFSSLALNPSSSVSNAALFPGTIPTSL